MALAKQCVPANSLAERLNQLPSKHLAKGLLSCKTAREGTSASRHCLKDSACIQAQNDRVEGPSPYAKPQHSPARRTAPAWKGIPPHAKPQHSRNSKKPHMVEHAEGRGSLGSLNPKRRSVQRVGAALSALGGKCEAGRPFRPPLSTALDRQARAARLP